MKKRLLTKKQAVDYLEKVPYRDWMALRAGIYSCGIEGIWSNELVRLWNGWNVGDGQAYESQC